MSTSFKPRPRRPTGGLTLIELMVSIAIGMVITIAVTSAYLGSAGSSRVAEAQGRMNEDAQAALGILAQQIRMAGDNPRRPDYDDATRRNPVYSATDYFIRGCDGTFTNITSAANIPALTCSAGDNSLPDSIAISYEADSENTISSSAVPTDCMGNALTAVTTSVNKWNAAALPVPAAVPTSVTYYVADNRYYIYTPTSSTTPSLYCKGSGGTEQALVENVENMQLLYGTAPPTNTLTVAGFLTANSVESDANLNPLTSPARWGRVMNVRICVIVRSAQPVAADASQTAYTDCSDTVVPATTDFRLRRAYYTTVVLRNQVPSP